MRTISLRQYYLGKFSFLRQYISMGKGIFYSQNFIFSLSGLFSWVLRLPFPMLFPVQNHLSSRIPSLYLSLCACDSTHINSWHEFNFIKTCIIAPPMFPFKCNTRENFLLNHCRSRLLILRTNNKFGAVILMANWNFNFLKLLPISLTL